MLIENPLKDHHIVQNEHDYQIKKGIEIEIPEVFKQTLITEGVIKSGVTKSKKKII